MAKYIITAIFIVVFCAVSLHGLAQQRTHPDSLFFLAIQENDVQKVKELLATGVDPDKPLPTDLQPTPLMYASAFVDGQILDLLLEQNVSLNEVDDNGDPVLHWATYYGHTNNMRKLIDAGADLLLQSKHGDALAVAFRLWHADSVIHVFRGTALEMEITTEVKRIVAAVREENHSLVASLLRNGVSPNARDGLGMSLLHHAVRVADREMVSLLVRKGGDPNVLNSVGQTPLAIAARFGHSDIAGFLIAKGADVNRAGGTYGLTPLIGAAVHGSEQMATQLMKAGATIDHADVVNQCTALHWSIFYQHTAFAKRLIENGASYTQKCLDNTQTAYSLAKSFQNESLIRLIEANRSGNNPQPDSRKKKAIDYLSADTIYSGQAQPGSPLSNHYIGFIPAVLAEPYDTIDAIEVNVFPFLYELRLGKRNDFSFQVRPILNYRFYGDQSGFSQLGGTLVANKYFLNLFDEDFWLKPQLSVFYTYAYNRLDNIHTMTFGMEPGVYTNISDRFSLSLILQPGINYYPDAFSRDFVETESGLKSHFGVFVHIGYNF